VRVSFHATLRPLVGSREAEVALPAGATVRQLAQELVRRWPALGEHLLTPEGSLSRRVAILVDGRSVRWLPEREDTVLSGEEAVHLFPPVAGGREPRDYET